jgi:hypothetical protein
MLISVCCYLCFLYLLHQGSSSTQYCLRINGKLLEGLFFWDVRSLDKMSTVHNHGLWTARPLKMGQRGCHETWLTKYQTRLRNIAGERRHHIRREEAWSQERQLFVLCERISQVLPFRMPDATLIFLLPKAAINLYCFLLHGDITFTGINPRL